LQLLLEANPAVAGQEVPEPEPTEIDAFIAKHELWLKLARKAKLLYPE
jgi:hypothetical protein